MKYALRRLASLFRRKTRDDDGAILVEFALIFPLMLLFFAVIVEGSRMMYSYQMATEGVREAGRWLARTAPIDVCLKSKSLATYADDLKTRVEQDLGGSPLFPALVTVNSVTPALICKGEAGDYRVSPAPIASVTANLTIEFPLGGIFGFFGDELTSVTTDVTDSMRIFGS